MKLSANEAISVVDKLTKLDMKSATSAQELAQALSKVANSARLAKVSQDEILGILSVGIETTQQSGDVIGTAVRSLLARFSNVKASKFGGSGEETEGTLNDTEAVLSKIGIRIRSASGEMRSFMDVLDDVAEKWDTLDDVSRNAISTAMAGTRQKEIFASIIENYDRVKELIGESANAAGTADEKYTAYMDSMEAATKRLQNAWEGFTQSLETSTVMKSITNTAAFFVENADKLKYLVTYIAAAGSVKFFNFLTNKGETGGWKGLVANIPFVGTKTNNILESIDKKVGNIERGVGADSLANQTKNGGFFKRLGGFLKTGFGFGDIYDPETGKSISYREAKAYGKLLKSTTGGTAVTDPQMNQYVKLLKQRKIGNVAMGATSAVLTNLFTTKQVGGSGFGKLVNTTNQTVEETTGDKIGRTVLSGALTGLGGYVLGPFGAIIGQTLGENFAGMFSTWFHRDELAMKQRVAEAKENLASLKNLDTTLDSINLAEEGSADEFANKLRDYFTDNPDLFKPLIGSLNDSKAIQGIDRISQLVNLVKNNNTADNEKILQALKVAIPKGKIGEIYDSQEEERAKIIKEEQSVIYSVPQLRDILDRVSQVDKSVDWSAITDGDWGTIEGRLAIFEKLRDINSENLKDILPDEYIDYYINKVKPLAIKMQALDDEILTPIAQFGFNKSNIANLSGYELTDLGVEGAVKKVADTLQDAGYNVMTNGLIHKDIYDQIMNQIKKSDIYKSLQYGTKTIGELDLNKEQDLKRFEQFAHAFGISIDKAKKLKEEFEDLSTAMAYMTPQEVLDYYNNLSSIFNDLATNAAVSAENIEKILTDENYKSLIPYLTKGNEALQANLYKRLLGGEKDFVYEASLFSSLMSNKDIFKSFTDKLEDEDLKKRISKLGYTSFQSIISAVQDGTIEGSDVIVEKAKEEIEAWNVEYKKDLEGTNKLISYQTFLLDKQITNLNDQKSALKDVNNEREKELNLIKARQALEDARKEKKRVYRAGVGFVMESNEEAINSAQKALDDLDVEKRQEEIQLRIDALQQEKDILENLPKEEEMAQLSKIYAQWAGDGEGSMNSVSKATVDLVAKYKDSIGALDAYKKFVDELRIEKPKDNTPPSSNNNTLGARRINVGSIEGVDDDKYKKNYRGYDGMSITFDGTTYEVLTSNKKGDIREQEFIKAKYKELYKNPKTGEVDNPKTGDVVSYGGNYYVYHESNTTWEKILNERDGEELIKAFRDKGYSSGTTSFQGGRALVNELGTEAVITPGGTLTALPSKTGIVPADITRNVWALGEVAPTLVAQLSSLNQKALTGNAGNTTYEEGQYIDNLTMNIYPTKDYDMDKLLSEARAKAKLTRHNN